MHDYVRVYSAPRKLRIPWWKLCRKSPNSTGFSRVSIFVDSLLSPPSQVTLLTLFFSSVEEVFLSRVGPAITRLLFQLQHAFWRTSCFYAGTQTGINGAAIDVLPGRGSYYLMCRVDIYDRYNWPCSEMTDWLEGYHYLIRMGRDRTTRVVRLQPGTGGQPFPPPFWFITLTKEFRSPMSQAHFCEWKHGY